MLSVVAHCLNSFVENLFSNEKERFYLDLVLFEFTEIPMLCNVLHVLFKLSCQYCYLVIPNTKKNGIYSRIVINQTFRLKY